MPRDSLLFFARIALSLFLVESNASLSASIAWLDTKTNLLILMESIDETIKAEASTQRLRVTI